MILPDNETRVDLLNNEAIAATIIKLLRDRPDQPATVGVHGDWGAGKSSVLEMIEAGFEDEERILCIKFNSWRFQGFEDAKIALLESIVTGLIAKHPDLAEAGEATKDIFHRLDLLKIAKKAGGFAFTAFSSIPTPDQIHAIVGKLEEILTDPEELVTKDNIQAGIGGVRGFLKPKDESAPTNVPEEINSFRKAFDDLLERAGVEQLVVLIDDLDRCLPDTAIETLEAVRLFVFTSRTAFVVAADEVMIEYAVRKHFPDLPDTTQSQNYAKNYLEKLIQVPFRIPALGDTETRTYVTLLLVGAELGENDVDFNKLISVARERLKRPWTASTLDAVAVRAALGDKAPRIKNALTLSNQIGPVLASGTKGNPRQIKRFLNTLVLRQRTAEARGFGEDVNLPILAKLMLAERFLPHLFDQIAAAAAVAADGTCSDLAALEAAMTTDDLAQEKGKLEKSVTSKGGNKPKDSKKIKAPIANGSALLGEWLSSSAVKDWARIQPLLGEEDLRPYLFVAKDRKDYFGSASALGHLLALVEKLLGSKFAVQGLENDLKQLATPEATEVFEAVCGRIIGSDNLDTEPPGVAGLSVLVKAQPSFQRNLVDFLGTLPHDQLGPWICRGWEGVLKEPEANRKFDHLLQIWAQEGGPILKAAAGGILRTRQQIH